jgi:hypothetical protein
MTSKLARERNLDVYTFPEHAAAARTRFVFDVRSQGREVFVYDEEFHTGGFTFLFLCVAVGPRPQHGQTAKTVREFIQAQ